MRRRAWIGGLASAMALGTAPLGCGGDGGGPGDDAGDGFVDVDAAEADVPADADATPPDGGEEVGDDGAGEAPPDDGGSEPVDPSLPGPFIWTVVDATVVRAGRTTPVSALLPELPAGAAAPLVLFLPGFQMRTAWYLPLCERLASHGFVVVRADPPGTLLDVHHPEQTLDAQAVLDWALDPAGPVGPRVDPSRIAASGHSNGGKISTMLAFADARVTALLGLDPVNGSGPLGFNPQQPDIVPEQVAPLNVPIGLLGETTNATGGIGGQPCAPAEQNFLTFYDAASGSPWVASWKIPGADHIDFVFDTSACGLPCRMCVEGTADEASVRATILTLGVAFLRLHFYGEGDQERWLLGDLLPAEILLQHRP